MSNFTRVVRWHGREFRISVEQQGSTWLVNTAGGPREASVVAVEPGVYSVLLDGRSFEIRPSELPIEIEDPRELRKAGAHSGLEGRQTIAAPMPGKVVRVLASEGDAVELGQGLVVIEAMKMQNELKSPKAGVVVSLPAKEGAAVAAGDVLAVVD